MSNDPINLINQGQISPMVAAIFAHITHLPVRERLCDLSVHFLMRDPRNARRVRPKDLMGKPDWVLAKIATDSTLRVFDVHKENLSRLKDCVPRAERLCEVMDRRGEPEDNEETQLRCLAHELYTKLSKLSFEDAEHHLSEFMRFQFRIVGIRSNRVALREECCPRERIGLSAGGFWDRLPSPYWLHRAGRDLNNCWSDRNSLASSYITLMRAGRTEFWVLRERNGGPALMALTFDCGANTIVEVRGPSNHVISMRNGAVRDFMRAKHCTATLLTFDIAQAIDVDRLQRIDDILREAAREVVKPKPRDS